MDGIVLNWYTNLLIKHPHTDWTQLRDKLLVRFSGTKFRNAHEALGSLFQEGSIEDYIEEFEALSFLIPDQLEEQAIRMFLCGLQPDIRNWVMQQRNGIRTTRCHRYRLSTGDDELFPIAIFVER